MPSYWLTDDVLEPVGNSTEVDVFHNGIREITVLLILLLLLYLLSFSILSLLHKKCRSSESEVGVKSSELDDVDEEPEEPKLLISNFWWRSTALASWQDDERAEQTGFHMCSLTLAVSIGATLLLPVSTVANEIVHSYPHSWYIAWLNADLILGLWNLVFVASNLCLFVLMPFAYLFAESEGLPWIGCRRGLLARARESMLTLMLLVLLVFGLMYVLAAVLDRDRGSIERLFRNQLTKHAYQSLPFVYSCVSLVGVVILLLCAPLGFSRMFGVVANLVVHRPTLMTRNLDEEFHRATFQEATLANIVQQHKRKNQISSTLLPPLASKGEGTLASYSAQLHETRVRIQSLRDAMRTSRWRRFLAYPLAMLMLMVITAMLLLSVVTNMFLLAINYKSIEPKDSSWHDLGLNSLSVIGVFGGFIEVVFIAYLTLISLAGLYSLPIMRHLKPKVKSTPTNHLILNCALYVVLSSALPLLSKILGITNFDLLGHFGQARWLGNYYMVMTCNAVFVSSAAISLLTTFTTKVREEVVNRIKLDFESFFGFRKLRIRFRWIASPFASSTKASPTIKAD